MFEGRDGQTQSVLNQNQTDTIRLKADLVRRNMLENRSGQLQRVLKQNQTDTTGSEAELVILIRVPEDTYIYVYIYIYIATSKLTTK